MTSKWDTSFILKRNKKTGNYSILKKGYDVRRVKYCIKNVYLPFGREYYNEKIMLNGYFDDSTNYNRNLIITLHKIIDAFTSLKDTKSGKYKYNINDKSFFSFLKEVESDKSDVGENNDEVSDTDKEEQKNDTKKYQIRLYLKYGAKVTHARYIGELSYDRLKGKKCNLNVELGSMWVNEDKSQYGINVYVTHITMLN